MLVIDMDSPCRCIDCDLYTTTLDGEPFCTVDSKDIDRDIYNRIRPGWCRLSDIDEAENAWRPIDGSDGMPCNGERVLFLWGPFVGEGWLNKSGKPVRYIDDYPRFPATHWRPMPRGPR